MDRRLMDRFCFSRKTALRRSMVRAVHAVKLKSAVHSGCVAHLTVRCMESLTKLSKSILRRVDEAESSTRTRGIEIDILNGFVWLGRHIAAGCPIEPLCRNCKKPGHIASEGHNEPVCNMCGKPGHIAKGCAPQEGGLPKSRLCNKCYRPGHVSVDCPSEKACNNCRQSGHWARDCINSPVRNGCSQPGHIA